MLPHPPTVQAVALKYLEALGAEVVKATDTKACYKDWTTLVIDDTTMPPQMVAL